MGTSAYDSAVNFFCEIVSILSGLALCHPIIRLTEWNEMKSFPLPPAPCNSISFELLCSPWRWAMQIPDQKIPSGHKIVTWQTFSQSWRCFEFVKNSINERNYTIYSTFSCVPQMKPYSLTHLPILLLLLLLFHNKTPLTFWRLCAEYPRMGDVSRESLAFFIRCSVTFPNATKIFALCIIRRK